MHQCTENAKKKKKKKGCYIKLTGTLPRDNSSPPVKYIIILKFFTN